MSKYPLEEMFAELIDMLDFRIPMDQSFYGEKRSFEPENAVIALKSMGSMANGVLKAFVDAGIIDAEALMGLLRMNAGRFIDHLEQSGEELK